LFCSARKRAAARVWTSALSKPCSGVSGGG
jgi:hypothetical protein